MALHDPSPAGASSALRRLSALLGRGPSRASVRHRLASLEAMVVRREAALAPTVVDTGGFEATGADLPPMYHAGSAEITEVLEEKFLDGWYGWGFYAAFDPEYVRRWYGPVVTRFEARPDAKVLLASVTPDLAHPDLLRKVAGSVAERVGENAEEMVEMVLENPIQWVHAVDELAIREYDVVVYSDDQVVAKAADAVVPAGEVPAPTGAEAAPGSP